MIQSFSRQAYPQAKSFILTDDKLKARLYDNLNSRYGLVRKPVNILVGITKISEIMIVVNLVSSKGEFNRKLKEKAIKVGLNWGDEEVIDKDIELDLKKENFHSIKFGQKYCELVVPELFGWRKMLYAAIRMVKK